jgi:PAS domain S-box-containing protein
MIDSLFTEEDKLNLVTRLISIAQNQGPETSNPDHQYLKIILDVFGSEAVSMILVDPDKHGALLKKESTSGVDWKITSNVPSADSLLTRSLKTSSIHTWTAAQVADHFSKKIDGTSVGEVKNFTSAPVRSHSIIFGAVGLINSEQFPLDDASKSLLALVLTAMADHLYLFQVIKESTPFNDELRINKAQLLSSRNTLRSIFDNIPQSFYIIDQNYVITAINHARAIRAGAPPKDLVGRICHEVLFNRETPCEKCLIQTTLNSKRSTRRVATLKSRNKNPQDWEITTYPINTSGDEVERVILLEQDITENRLLEAELLQSEKLAAVGQLAAGIAHEINNPLTAVLINSQILLEDLPVEQKDNIESVKLIEMAAVRASQVIKNLLGLVRKESYEFEQMDLNESIQRALMLVSHEFLTRQINIFFDRAEDLPVFIGSTNHLQGVWINLLMNSIEAIGGEKGEIKIATHYEEGTFYVEIRDSGAGISNDNLEKIFEPYFTTKRSGQGTGLGLSLVKRTIEAHCGQIMVESSPGEGARFTIILPEKNRSEESKNCEDQ